MKSSFGRSSYSSSFRVYYDVTRRSSSEIRAHARKIQRIQRNYCPFYKHANRSHAQAALFQAVVIKISLFSFFYRRSREPARALLSWIMRMWRCGPCGPCDLCGRPSRLSLIDLYVDLSWVFFSSCNFNSLVSSALISAKRWQLRQKVHRHPSSREERNVTRDKVTRV